MVVLAVVLGAGFDHWYTSQDQYSNRWLDGIFRAIEGKPTVKVEAESSQPGKKKREPTAKVKVVTLKRGKIEDAITAYGVVIATPGESNSFSVPFECRVWKVFITVGQVVEADDPLMEVGPSPETQFQLDKAKSQFHLAKSQLKIMRKRIKMQLATRQNLLSAEQQLQISELRLKNLQSRSSGDSYKLFAKASGVVSQIMVRQGQILPAGAILLQTIDQSKISVQLGIEIEDIIHLQTGQEVRLYPVNAADGHFVKGYIRLISQHVNPKTRLANVLVSPESGTRMLLNEYVRGEIVIEAHQSLIIPRGAVLPEGDHHILYLIKGNRATKRKATIGLDNDRMFEVFGEGLSEGMEVVVVGNSQLQDGMAVEVESN
ncbi:MAG: efflux RND transporter periplasmic adaptor subunit [Nitrospinales bacterium]